MEEKGYRNKKIELVFPEPSLEIESKFQRKDAAGNLMEQCAVDIEGMASWFKQYRVETIELWINGAIQTDKQIKLGVSTKGEGGLKLTLKLDKDSKT